MNSTCAYLDNAATTPMDPRVGQAMAPYLGTLCGNPSSLHQVGRRAKAAVDLAREQVAALLNAKSSEIIFTASGTEATNLVLIGIMAPVGKPTGHLITSQIEHPSVLETCRHLELLGVPVTYLPVEPNGIVNPDSLLTALRSTTRLVSIMAANNVVGTIQPIEALCRMTHSAGALFHTDGVQAVGKMPIDVERMGIDFLSLSAHKIHGPQGLGALFTHSQAPIAPIVHGGGQERGLRSGTENVAGIVGFGAAAKIAKQEQAQETARLVTIREHILDELERRVPRVYLIGDRFRRLPGHLCLGLSGQEGEAIRLMLALDERGIAVSSGSACSARHGNEPSHVLRAMGFDPIIARGSLRVTLGRFNTDADIDRFLDGLSEIASTLRPMTTHSH